MRWTDQISERPAVKRGRMVNRVMGEPSSQLHERHDASDFETKTQDKLAPADHLGKATMRQWTIDAFASAAFKGNQACVVEPFDAWPADAWMQSLAAENNQAETAFLLRTPEPDRFGLRWFTPLLEVPLCGHATLASGHALLSEIGVAGDRVRFDTLSGELSVRLSGELYEMELPADPPRRVEEPEGLAEALGVTPAEVWAAQYLIAVLATSTRCAA